MKAKPTSINNALEHVVMSEDFNAPTEDLIEVVIGALNRPKSELRKAVEFYVNGLHGR